MKEVVLTFVNQWHQTVKEYALEIPIPEGKVIPVPTSGIFLKVEVREKK